MKRPHSEKTHWTQQQMHTPLQKRMYICRCRCYRKSTNTSRSLFFQLHCIATNISTKLYTHHKITIKILQNFLSFPRQVALLHIFCPQYISSCLGEQEWKGRSSWILLKKISSFFSWHTRYFSFEIQSHYFPLLAIFTGIHTATAIETPRLYRFSFLFMTASNFPVLALEKKFIFFIWKVLIVITSSR